ncbi:hypothetical protein MAPG_02876 [Magnaporthiopsis poae ATCC 64411]|uniref:Uncharacterized protein n=1 Tax=Magnaporthiopsis poae (strain ATCC 64411 / 73-15) TaxID=644358 RepID=A0A0C4DSJ4_MAGP6|nr:hypothetical protein MAPG_02876 [Magnaporthiopsis poae ATCC 64411]
MSRLICGGRPSDFADLFHGPRSPSQWHRPLAIPYFVIPTEGTASPMNGPTYLHLHMHGAPRPVLVQTAVEFVRKVLLNAEHLRVRPDSDKTASLTARIPTSWTKTIRAVYIALAPLRRPTAKDLKYRPPSYHSGNPQ